MSGAPPDWNLATTTAMAQPARMCTNPTARAIYGRDYLICAAAVAVLLAGSVSLNVLSAVTNAVF